MSASALFSIGTKAMTASYAALATTGHNISNANVQGYSRQQVELASYKMGVADSGADADAVLKELDLYALSNATAEDLGYGEQRRLDLALALVGRPTVLLLDEPMAGLSVKESLDLAQHLKALTSRWDVSVLLVEHDMDVVFGISDVVTMFELGRVIASGDPATVRADARVREAYLGSAA